MRANARTAVNNYAVHFDEIVSNDEMSAFFNYNVHFKLYSHVDCFVKNLFYRNPEAFHRALHYTTGDFDKVYGLHNKRRHYNIREADLKLVKDRDTIVDNGVTQEDLHSRWVLLNLKDRKATPTYSSFILCFGDKDRGMIEQLIKNIYTEIKTFNNYLIKIEDIKFRFDLMDDKAKGSFSFETYEEAMKFYRTRLQPTLYSRLAVITLFLEVGSKMVTTFGIGNLKKLHIIIMNDTQVNDIELFVNQMRGVLYAQKVLWLRDATVQKLDYFVRGIDKYMIVVELPEVLKLNDKVRMKYKRYRKILEIVTRLAKIGTELQAQKTSTDVDLLDQLLFECIKQPKKDKKGEVKNPEAVEAMSQARGGLNKTPDILAMKPSQNRELNQEVM
jgi:hypothetical protein